jgi:predicted esterase
MEDQRISRFCKGGIKHYSFHLSKTIAIGFPNDANMGTSLLLLYPETLMVAILFE